MMLQSALMLKIFFIAALFAFSSAAPYSSPDGRSNNNTPYHGPPSPPSKFPHHKAPPHSPVHKPAPSKVTTTITVTPTPTSAPAQCNTGPIQCCDSVQKAKSVSSVLGLLGVVLDDLTVDVGMNCSPLSVVGLSSGECNASAVCCENNSFNGLISIGCSPINI